MVGQLITKCLSLRRELRNSVSTLRPKEIRAVDAISCRKPLCDLHSPQVEATINGCMVRGCLIDGGAVVNVIASLFMKEANPEPNWSSSLKLKVMDQHSVKSLGLITNLPFIVNCIIVTVDFYFLEIIDSTGRYLVILGRPWLTEVNAVNNWKPGKLKIGPRRNRVRIRVMKRSSSESEGASSPEESSGDSGKSSWSSNYSSSPASDSSEDEGTVELFILDTLP